MIIAAQFDRVGEFYDGLASIVKNDKWGYVDKSGKEAFRLAKNMSYAYDSKFSEGLVKVFECND